MSLTMASKLKVTRRLFDVKNDASTTIGTRSVRRQSEFSLFLMFTGFQRCNQSPISVEKIMKSTLTDVELYFRYKIDVEMTMILPVESESKWFCERTFPSHLLTKQKINLNLVRFHSVQDTVKSDISS